MLTRVTTIEELKGIVAEMLINNTDKVTKVSSTSVVNGFCYGIAKIGQKALKDTVVTESRIFPETAYGAQLDKCAKDRGVAERFSESGSSVYVRITADPGTVYTAGVHTFTGKEGIIFDIENTTTVGADGFVYAKLRSKTNGSSTNVEALTITRVFPEPTGHIYCINEFKATGGSDFEDDETFRARIIDAPNIVAKDTLSKLTQAFMLINNNVLRLYYNGTSSSGKLKISVLSQNGINFSDSEFSDILKNAEGLFSLAELEPFGNSFEYAIELQNVVWQPIDVSCRLEVNSSYDYDDVRREIQIRLNKHFDYRYWNAPKIEWDDLLEIVKSTPGVKQVFDNYFSPNLDIQIEKGKIPRIRGFMMLKTDGSVASNSSNTLNPIHYPAIADFAYQRNIFKSLIE